MNRLCGSVSSYLLFLRTCLALIGDAYDNRTAARMRQRTASLRSQQRRLNTLFVYSLNQPEQRSGELKWNTIRMCTA